MEIESLTYLWIHTANRLSSVTFSLTSLTSTLDAYVRKWWSIPYIGHEKGVDQVREGQGQSLVNSGTASHWLMDREAVARMSGLHQTYLIS